jgi:hypothetical protein
MVAKHEKMRKMDSWNLISLNKQGLNIRANKRGEQEAYGLLYTKITLS